MRIDISFNPATAGAAAAGPRPTGSGASAQKTGASESTWSVGRALNTAKSAYHNERFASVLEQLADPRSAITAALMRSEQGQGATVAFAQSAYAENS